MTEPLSTVIVPRLEKAVVDNGFGEELPRTDEWLASVQRHPWRLPRRLPAAVRIAAAVRDGGSA